MVDGTALIDFLEGQIDEGIIRFPFYLNLINDYFIPNAELLSWIVITGQMMVGISVLTGTFTNLGLQGGLFMNLNFILAGRVNPSAFYIVIQLVLFIGNTGSIIGVDTLLDKKIPYSFLVAQNDYKRRYVKVEKIMFLLIAIASFIGAGYAFQYIQDFSPSSVDDPAMLLFILGQITGVALLIDYFRLQSPDIEPPQITSPPDLAFIHGTAGKYITWQLNDPNPDTYVILENSKGVKHGTWKNGDNIIHTVDHLNIGHHRVVLTATDWFGNTNSDAVSITVIDPLQVEDSNTLNLLQYFRETLVDQIQSHEQSLRILIHQVENLTSAMTNMDSSTASSIREKYKAELDRLEQRQVYIEQSIEHTRDLLKAIDQEQSRISQLA